MKKLLFALLFLPCLVFAQTSGNAQINLFPSQAFTSALINTNSVNNSSCKGAHFIVNMSSYTSGNLTVHIQGGYNDPILGAITWYDILVSPALSSVGGSPYIMKVYPGATILANYSSSDFLPYTWRVQLVGASSPSMTVSIGANCEY